MVHAVIGRGLRVRAMIVSLGLLRLALDGGRGALRELGAGVVLRGRRRLAAGVMGAVFHLCDVVLHVFGDFGHHPTRMN